MHTCWTFSNYRQYTSINFTCLNSYFSAYFVTQMQIYDSHSVAWIKLFATLPHCIAIAKDRAWRQNVIPFSLNFSFPEPLHALLASAAFFHAWNKRETLNSFLRAYNSNGCPGNNFPQKYFLKAVNYLQSTSETFNW